MIEQHALWRLSYYHGNVFIGLAVVRATNKHVARRLGSKLLGVIAIKADDVVAVKADDQHERERMWINPFESASS